MEKSSPFYAVLVLQTKNIITQQTASLDLFKSDRLKMDSSEDDGSIDTYIATLEEWLHASKRFLADLQNEET